MTQQEGEKKNSNNNIRKKKRKRSNFSVLGTLFFASSKNSRLIKKRQQKVRDMSRHFKNTPTFPPNFSRYFSPSNFQSLGVKFRVIFNILNLKKKKSSRRKRFEGYIICKVFKHNMED